MCAGALRCCGDECGIPEEHEGRAFAILGDLQRQASERILWFRKIRGKRDATARSDGKRERACLSAAVPVSLVCWEPNRGKLVLFLREQECGFRSLAGAHAAAIAGFIGPLREPHLMRSR